MSAPPSTPDAPDLTPILRRVRDRRTGLALAFLLGAVAALGQAPVSWPWLAIIAFALAIGLFTLPIGVRRGAWRGLAFGTGYFAVALFWIVEPFFVDPLRHGWMAPFALVLLSAGLALFWALAFGLAQALGRGSRRGRVLWLVVALTGAEIARSVVLTGFPWALVGHIWVGWPQMHLAALGGADALTLVTLLAAALPALLGARRLMLGAIAGAALAAAPGGYARVIGADAPLALSEPRQIVRLVQPNAAQHLKWRPDMVPVFFDRALALTGQEGALGPPDLVIWPETAIPYALDSAAPALTRIAAAARGAPVVAGVQRRGPGGHWRNSLAVLGTGGEVRDLYDKHHLVPFGEYMPFADVFARIEVFGLAANLGGGYRPGPGPRLLDLGAAGRALPLICYEAIFARDIRALAERPAWLMHVTNDAWFGELSGPYQHLAQARLRAVEFGLPVLRAANTGVSAVIDARGRVLTRVPLGEAGVVDAPLPAALPPTPYARLGNLPVLVALVLLALLAGLAARTGGLAPGTGEG